VPLFGWAKPVPVDERNLKNPRTDMFWIAAAGPLSNLLLGVIAAFALVIFESKYGIELSGGDPLLTQVHGMIHMFLGINVFLAVFNLIPLHPLDGGKVIARFLPYSVNRRLEDMQQHTSLLLLAIFLIPGGMRVIALPANYMMMFLERIAQGVVGA
jgi:Zn-dependent protease